MQIIFLLHRIRVIKIIIALFLLMQSFDIAWSQDKTQQINRSTENQYIKWISSYPLSEKKNKNNGLKKRLANFIFGKSPIIINKPLNILAQNPDFFWILDQGSGKIININHNSAVLPRFLNKSLNGFSSLVGICYVNNDILLFTDSRLNQIFLIDLADKEVVTLNDSLILNQPTGIAYSKITDEIWVVETNTHRLSVLDKNGNIKKRIGKRGNKNAEFNFPTFIWIDKIGNIYVVDSMNFRIQIFNKNGDFVSTFGEIGDATGYFARPKGIATDSFGNIYIADALFHVIQIFDKKGNFLYKFGEQGHENGQFWMPSGIFIDDNNYIYVADSYNSRIQIFKLMK
ncbi:MAG: 6-bladed beta-propeller [Bacteroidales bacterium]|nr:6-bladed beta-propeller [Bacteroidales bacterium]MBN2755911.1 6-bladed beta-propeller [Bacteroidales bacterium]